MDYEKAYKKALERANSFELPEYKNIMVSIFPELKESEDDRISREITEFILTHRIDEPNDIEDTNTWLAWLEKQGNKPKQVSIWKHWKDGIAGNGEGEVIYLIKDGYTYSLSSCLGCECDYIELSELDKLMREEKQGEHESTDNKEKLDVLNFIRKETCCGLAEANNALLKLIKVLKEHPFPIMDKPRKLKIEWEE